MTGLDCLREEMEKRGLKEVRWHEQQLRYLKKAVDEWNKEAEKAREHRKHFEAYIDEFNKSLQECETAEGRRRKSDEHQERNRGQNKGEAV